MSKKSKIKAVLLRALLAAMVLTALLILPQSIMLSSASPAGTTYFLLSVSPTRIQEGLNTNITVNLEADANTTYTVKINVTAPDSTPYSSNVTVVTDEIGVGSNLTEFWGDFVGANTNLVGTYNVTLFNIAGNETLATSSFTVGLTDKLKYVKAETVGIRASGYNANETVLVDIKFDNVSISGFPRSVNASAEGVVTDSWIIPTDASLGVYTVTLSNATTTVKSVSDVQSFTVEGVCEIQTRNLANQTVPGALVEVWNATSGLYLNLRNTTNETGWVKFVLGAGNYTFKALWRNAEVGAVNKNVTENVTLRLELRLSNLKLAVKDELGAPIPFVDLNLSYNYTTRANITTSEASSFTANINGTVQLQNTFTNISYLIEARRYGYLFNTTRIASLPAQDWNNITIIAPTCTMFVQVLDSQDDHAEGLEVVAYEWSSGVNEPLQRVETNSDGNVTFALTFGRYRLRMYEDTTFVKEVTVDVVQNPLFLVIRLDVYNVDLNVFVVDYFGQPVPNVSVELQRKSNSDYETMLIKTTGSNGVASFSDVIGGDSRVYVSVAGRPGETSYLYLVGPARDVFFKLDGYVTVVGYALETSQFVTFVILLIIIVSFIVASTYKRLPRLLQRRRK